MALPPFLYTVVTVLCQEIFEPFKVSPKRLIGVLFELHKVLSDQRSFVTWVEFLQEYLDESSHVVTMTVSTAKLYSHFFARSFREKGIKHSLTASSPS